MLGRGEIPPSGMFDKGSLRRNAIDLLWKLVNVRAALEAGEGRDCPYFPTKLRKVSVVRFLCARCATTYLMTWLP